jgi:hypothetical protein
LPKIVVGAVVAAFVLFFVSKLYNTYVLVDVLLKIVVIVAGFVVWVLP